LQCRRRVCLGRRRKRGGGEGVGGWGVEEFLWRLRSAHPTRAAHSLQKSASQNINLPPALLSRFDLVYLMLDRPDMDADLRLAHHITLVRLRESGSFCHPFLPTPSPCFTPCHAQPDLLCALWRCRWRVSCFVCSVSYARVATRDIGWWGLLGSWL